MRKFVVTGLLLSFFFQQVAWAFPNPFKIDGQHWGDVSRAPEDINGEMDNNVFVLHTPEGRRLYRIKPGHKLTITDLTTLQQQTLPISTNSITLSKNYLFITLNIKEESETHGFYVMRLIDFYHYGFKAPIPLFFIPTSREIGHVTRVLVEHDDENKEFALLLQTDTANARIIEMVFSDVKDLIKAQILSLAITHLMKQSTSASLALLLDGLKNNLKLFFERLNADLKKAGGANAHDFASDTLQNIDWQRASAEALTEAFISTDENDALHEIKTGYARELSGIISNFYLEYNDLIENTELTYEPIRSSQHLLSPADLAPIENIVSSATSERSSEEDTAQALKTYGGILLAVVFVTLVLPKILKRPFSQMAADYSTWHFRILNAPWIKNSIAFLTPNALKNTPRYQAFMERLTVMQREYSGLRATSNQFRRGMWKATGETTAVILSEMALRPWLRDMEDGNSDNAIILTQPFDHMHSLWIQKNVLMRLVNIQLFGSITTTIQLTIMEEELNKIIQKFILNPNLEDQLGVRFNDMQRRQLATQIEDDIKLLKNELAVSLSQFRAGHGREAVPRLQNLNLTSHIERARNNWIRNIDTHVMTLSDTLKQSLTHTFDARLKSVAQVSLNTHLHAVRNPNFLKKCWRAIGNAVQRGMMLILGERTSIRLNNFFHKTFRVWLYDLKPAFVQHLLLQPLTRGGFNLSIFLFNRAAMLLIFTPFFISSYEMAKRRINFRNPRQDFFFGLAYGLISCFAYSYLFFNIYEQGIRDSSLDFEFNIFKKE